MARDKVPRGRTVVDKSTASPWGFGGRTVVDKSTASPWGFADAVEVVVLNRLDDPLLGFEISSKGVLLSCRDDEARFVFEAETLRRYQDWQYFARRYKGLAEAA